MLASPCSEVVPLDDIRRNKSFSEREGREEMCLYFKERITFYSLWNYEYITDGHSLRFMIFELRGSFVK
jgi:hypothetical protein